MLAARICGGHQRSAFVANSPGRRNVHWSPEVAISRSICSASARTGLGCWNKGCAVLIGAERNTMRRACFEIRSKAGAAAASGAVHTRNTASTSSRHSSRVSATVRSPRTTSTCGGKPAVCGLRVSAWTRTPVDGNCEITWRPTLPVAPMMRKRFMQDHTTGGGPIEVGVLAVRRVVRGWPPRRNSVEHTLYTYVFVNLRPVYSRTAADDLESCALFRSCLGKSPGPRHWNTNRPPIHQLGSNRFLGDRNTLNTGLDVSRNAHAQPPKSSPG